MLRKFAIGIKVIKPVEGGKGRTGRPGQVYDFSRRLWRVRFADDNREELTASERRVFGVGGRGWGRPARVFRAPSPSFAPPLKNLIKERAARPESTFGYRHGKHRRTWVGGVGFEASAGVDGRGSTWPIDPGCRFWKRLFFMKRMTG